MPEISNQFQRRGRVDSPFFHIYSCLECMFLRGHRPNTGNRIIEVTSLGSPKRYLRLIPGYARNPPYCTRLTEERELTERCPSLRVLRKWWGFCKTNGWETSSKLSKCCIESEAVDKIAFLPTSPPSSTRPLKGFEIVLNAVLG